MTVAACVKASYTHFDVLREKAREIKARFEQEDDELRQAVRPLSPYSSVTVWTLVACTKSVAGKTITSRFSSRRHKVGPLREQTSNGMKFLQQALLHL